MKKKTDRLIALACSLIMVTALLVTFTYAPVGAGNILRLTDRERDPVLTESQIAELRNDLAETRTAGVSQRIDAIVLENEEKNARLQAALEQSRQLDELIAQKSAVYNAYDEEWISLIKAVQNDPEVLAASAAGGDDAAMAVVLEKIGKTEAEYDAFQAQSAANFAELEELAAQREQLQIEIAVLLPEYGK